MPGSTQHLTSHSVQEVPKLTREGYTTQPSLQQLAALAAQDPGLLAAVSNFVVALADVGSVRWLQPVDLRGLDLDAIITMGPGVVEVRAYGASLVSSFPRVSDLSRWDLRGLYQGTLHTWGRAM